MKPMTSIIPIAATCLALSVFGVWYAEQLALLHEWDEAQDVTRAVCIVNYVSLGACMWVVCMNVLSVL
jgi:hypothetical protein